MRSRRRFWWATSLAIVVSGCATSGALPEIEGLPGKISGQLGRRGVVIAAPHGNSDARTGEIAAELGRRTGFGVVVATGFNLEPDTRERPGRRYQVNRPFEGTPGPVRLRTLLELIRDAYLRANREAPRLEILVEPANPVRYAASGAKRDGILKLPQRALHIELPKAARTDWRETYIAILADFLVQAVPPSAGR